jgi:hypothetical protein
LELELLFEDLVDDLVDATVDIGVEDLAVADAPGGALGSASAGPVSVSAGSPAVRTSIELPPLADAYEPGVVVRVWARTTDDRDVEFLNLDATPLPPRADGTLRVVLSRIK